MLEQSERDVVAERDSNQARLAEFVLTPCYELLSTQPLRVHIEEEVYSPCMQQRAT
jgi:hypothetical protein